MWAVAAQPRVGLTPTIPTPSFDGAVVTRTSSSAPGSQAATRGCASADRGLACAHGSIRHGMTPFDFADTSTILPRWLLRQQKVGRVFSWRNRDGSTPAKPTFGGAGCASTK